RIASLSTRPELELFDANPRHGVLVQRGEGSGAARVGRDEQRGGGRLRVTHSGPGCPKRHARGDLLRGRTRASCGGLDPATARGMKQQTTHLRLSLLATFTLGSLLACTGVDHGGAAEG